MTRGFSFRPEPFLWPTESEWEGEASRTGPDYIRWVQSSLNRVLGLRLAVDGIMGPATRSAVRSFQQRKGLAVDGIVGPNTEAALIAAGAPRLLDSSSAAGSAGLPSYIPTRGPSRAAPPVACHAPRNLCEICEVMDNFDLNKYTLNPEHLAKIVEIADQIIESQDTARPIRSVRIVGHADPSGTPEYNLQLGKNRAMAVKDELDGLLRGVKPTIHSRVQSRGEAPIRGVSDPAKLRRVDVCLQSTLLKWFETCGMQPVRGGNDVQYFIDGRTTFAAMVRAIKTATSPGHYIYLLGWWLSDDFELIQGDPKSTISWLFCNASQNGIQVRAMLWDYPAILGRAPQNYLAVHHINKCPNGAAIVDGRTLDFGSHHQKILVVKGEELIAFCGGIDINPDLVRNTNRNLGEPFHDVHCRIKGPAAYDLLKIFLERWQDNSHSADLDAAKHDPLRGLFEPDPPRAGNTYVQIGRTYGNGTSHPGIPGGLEFGGYKFSPDGEQSARRMILKAICEARRFIYIEDQYLVNMEISRALVAALPNIQHLTILVPRGSITDLNNPIFGEKSEQVHFRRREFIRPLKETDRGKVRVFSLAPPPIPDPKRGTYVHSKIMLVDDEYAIIGSVNLNRRSLTHDSEALAGIYDPSCNSLAKRLRIALWGKHINININIKTEREKLEDGVKSADLWFAQQDVNKVHVETYDETKDIEVFRSARERDLEWNQIDPNGA